MKNEKKIIKMIKKRKENKIKMKNEKEKYK
jgi:hypothetical protein